MTYKLKLFLAVSIVFLVFVGIGYSFFPQEASPLEKKLFAVFGD